MSRSIIDDEQMRTKCFPARRPPRSAAAAYYDTIVEKLATELSSSASVSGVDVVGPAARLHIFSHPGESTRILEETARLIAETFIAMRVWGDVVTGQ